MTDLMKAFGQVTTFKTRLLCGQNWSVNGSLIGATPYGMKLGFAPERPQQLLRCIDSERGFTISAPILTD